MKLLTLQIAFTCIISFHVLRHCNSVQVLGLGYNDTDINMWTGTSHENWLLPCRPAWHGDRVWQRVKILIAALLRGCWRFSEPFLLFLFQGENGLHLLSPSRPSYFWFSFSSQSIGRSARPRGASEPSWRCCTARTAEVFPPWDLARTTASTSWRAAWPTRLIWTPNGICS